MNIFSQLKDFSKITMFRFSVTFSFAFILLSGCGGDEPAPTEETSSVEDTVAVANGQAEEKIEDPLEPQILEPEEETEPVEAPNPNGVFLPTYEDKEGKMEVVKLNNHPVYSNGKGYFLWTNGSLWKITTKAGSGRTIASGGEEIVGSWPNGASARFSPDDEYAKQAMFRLAVSFQGSQDNENAIRLFQQFVTLFPEDKLVAEVYLSMGDLSTSGLGPDVQPSMKQIRQARNSYSMVREKTQEIGLISDSIANEGGLLERVGENPEGLVNHFLTFDKDSDKCVGKSEFGALQNDLSDSFPMAFDSHDINGDEKLQFEELYDAASTTCYKSLELLYTNYMQNFGSQEGAQVAKATEKIGFAKEKLGQPSAMLQLYFEDIQKFGNNPNNLGVDDILKKYCEKYQYYEDRFGQTLEILEKLQNPSEAISFSFTDRKGIEQQVSGTIEEIILDRSKSLTYLSSQYSQMDPKIYEEIVKFRGGVFNNPAHIEKFKGYLKKYQNLQSGFPKKLSPSKAFAAMLQEAESGNQKTLELRMRANLDRIGSRIGSGYNPQTNEFPAASPSVLVWMGEKMLNQNSLNDALAAMERLTQVYPNAEGELLFSANYIVGQVHDKNRDFTDAASSYDAAITNAPWHAKANEARLRKGYALFEIAKSDKDNEKFILAQSTFGEARDSDESSMELKGECSYMMGECLKEIRDYTGASMHFDDTTSRYASSGKWAEKAFDQAIYCYEKIGRPEQIDRLEQRRDDWLRRYQ
jgi:TolA-binding protein